MELGEHCGCRGLAINSAGEWVPVRGGGMEMVIKQWSKSAWVKISVGARDVLGGRVVNTGGHECVVDKGFVWGAY